MQTQRGNDALQLAADARAQRKVAAIAEVGEWFAMEAAAALGMSPGVMFLKLRSILG